MILQIKIVEHFTINMLIRIRLNIIKRKRRRMILFNKRMHQYLSILLNRISKEDFLSLSLK